jgi:signal transduction histidine kinase
MGALAGRSLGPWLPALTIAVGPADPERLMATKFQKRRIRIVIVLIAVGMSVVGVVLSARLLNRELESARIKADFAANVSHELRSPITQIRLKGEALQLGLTTDDVDRQHHYDAVVREAERLSRLVDNVLDFAAIEQGAKRYTFRPEDLGDVLRNTVESTRNALESGGLEVELDVPDDLPVVWIDREAISQVIINLLSNATKYGADGGWVGVRARADEEGVDLTIRDRGLGISKEDQLRIWDRFYRSADPNVRRRRGTGIGLTIVRYIVDEHGGSITVDSSPGKGTTFTIHFPLEPRDSGA